MLQEHLDDPFMSAIAYAPTQPHDAPSTPPPIRNILNIERNPNSSALTSTSTFGSNPAKDESGWMVVYASAHWGKLASDKLSGK